MQEKQIPAAVRSALVSFLDNVRIPSMNRQGPMSRVSIPRHQLVFHISQQHRLAIHAFYFQDGTVQEFEDGEQPVAAPVIEAPLAAQIEAPAPVVTAPETSEPTEAAESGEGQEETQSEEAGGEATDETEGEEEGQEGEELQIESLLDTVEEEGDEIKVHPLPLEQYASRTREEILEFLLKISAALPDEANEIIGKKNVTKKTLLEVIEAYVIDDESEGSAE